MRLDNTQQTFLALVRAGLWEQDVRLSEYSSIDYQAVYTLAEEQSVMGLVAAGIEHIVDVKIPKEIALSIAGNALQLEQRNLAMNKFIGLLNNKLKKSEVFAILVKGQGIAQCYERPLWRASGDVDLLLDEVNYHKAKEVLIPLTKEIEEENTRTLHQGLFIDTWEIELHGSLRGELWKSIDKCLDKVQEDTFKNKRFRDCKLCNVNLPAPDNDLIFIFTHILQHFFIGGIGIRQICDWCRLLWIYSPEINVDLLKQRLHKMGLMSEWKSFAALAVHSLGMPADLIPLYDSSQLWEKKSRRIIMCIFKTGNFGHNKNENIKEKDSFLVRKVMAVRNYTAEAFSHFIIFPLDTLKVWFSMMKSGTLSALHIY